MANVGRIAAAAWGQGVTVVTAWWGSPANLLHRDPAEGIVPALADWLDGPGRSLLAGRRLEVLGRWPELCPELGPVVERVRAVAGEGPETFCLLMGYDGRDEIRAAVAEGGADFERRLWTARLPPVDLVLRTGGEAHLSAGFLVWQIAEARLSVSRTLWPAYQPDQLRRLLARAAARTRRYGR